MKPIYNHVSSFVSEKTGRHTPCSDFFFPLHETNSTAFCDMFIFPKQKGFIVLPKYAPLTMCRCFLNLTADRLFKSNKVTVQFYRYMTTIFLLVLTVCHGSIKVC